MGVTKHFIENILSPILMAIIVYKLPIENVWLRVVVGLTILGALCFITACFVDKDEDADYPSVMLIVLVIISLIISFFLNIFKLIIKFAIFIKDKVKGKKT